MVIAQAERRIRDRDRVRFEAGRRPSIEGVGGLRFLAPLVQGAEGGAGRDASGVPPRGGRIVSNGDDKPFRARAKSSCFCNLSVTAELCQGCLIADIPAIVGSLDIVMGEIDR